MPWTIATLDTNLQIVGTGVAAAAPCVGAATPCDYVVVRNMDATVTAVMTVGIDYAWDGTTSTAPANPYIQIPHGSEIILWVWDARMVWIWGVGAAMGVGHVVDVLIHARDNR